MNPPSPEQRIADRLAGIYEDPQILAGLPEKVLALVEKWTPRIPSHARGWSERDALLITYADSLLDPLRTPLETLRAFLEIRVGERVSFLHLLPFFPSTSDHGFSVSDFRAVRPDLGSWDEIDALAGPYRPVFDAVLNHVSSESAYVRGYLAGEPAFDSFCISRETVPDTGRVVRPRQSPLFHEFPLADGGRADLWTTFSRDQVDLDFRNPAVLLEVLDVLLEYASRGAAMIRLDAIPYLWKESGTSCIHLPQTHEIIRLVRAVFDAAAPHVLLLSETNVPHQENISYFGGPARDEAQVIYNFSLPPLLVHTLTRGDATRLTAWARTLEDFGEACTFLNITATHDGIGMRPTEGILSEEERADLLRLAEEHGGRVNYKANPDGSATPYELNINFFDAINGPNASSSPGSSTAIDRFLVSQAIPMALRGIPGIYLHSLLGSRGDASAVDPADPSTFRSVNREELDAAALAAELDDPASHRARVLDGILRLLDARRALPALHPASPMEILEADPALFALRRGPRENQLLTALFNVSGQAREFPPLGAPSTDRLSGDEFSEREALPLAPYQVRWLISPCE